MKKLQGKLVLIAFFSSLVVFLSVSFIIKIVMTVYQNIGLDSTTELIAMNGGKFPEKSEYDRLENIGGIKENIQYTEELVFTTRYFVVHLDENDTAEAANISAIASVDVYEAKRMAERVVKKGEETGYDGVFRYRLWKLKDHGKIVIFLDCTDVINVRDFVFLVSIAVALIFTLLITLLFGALSKRVLDPFEKNNLKQRQFITDASHELKTPLAIISANAQVLQYKNGDNEWIKNIISQSNRMSDMIGALLSLSRMEEMGEVVYEPSVDLTGIVKKTVDDFTEIFENKHVTVKTDIEEAVYANVNSAQISQMVSLLTENASKYVTEEGDVVISLFRMGRNIIFKIYNTATIDDSVDLNRLFDRFYRSDSSRNSKTGGHGIGLSVVWRIAQNHKGRVFCKREEGGVSFTATISNRIRVRRQKQKIEKGKDKKKAKA